MEAQPNGARKKRPCAKVGNLKIAIPHFVVWANLKENARLCRARTFNENSGRKECFVLDRSRPSPCLEVAETAQVSAKVFL